MYGTQEPPKETRTERRLADLLGMLAELLLAHPKLRGVGPDEIFSATLDVLTNARVTRSAVLDEPAAKVAIATEAIVFQTASLWRNIVADP